MTSNFPSLDKFAPGRIPKNRTWAIMYAINRSDASNEATGYKLFKTLLEAGADPRVKGGGRTGIQWADKNGHERIVNKLQKCGLTL